MAEQWYVGRQGNREGPMSSADLRRLAATGLLAPSDLVWRDGMTDWVAAGSIRGLFAVAEPSLVPGVPANPYASPAAADLQPVGQDEPGGPLRYADWWPRVGAALLDGIFLGLMGCIPGLIIGLGFAVLAGNDPDAQAAASLAAQLCSQLLSLVISATYYVTLESSLKQGTWGKQIVGIKVTDMNGNRLTAGRALGRWAAKFITGCTCGIGLLMPLFTEKRQTLHDMIAGCLALKK